jgi:hypothetical protein
MLPDFAAMCGNSLREVFDQEVRAGVELHLATDQVFHRAPSFVELRGGAFETLEQKGVKRASARAVAHAGVEMMLDGALSSDQAVQASYQTALRAGATEDVARSIHWRHPWRRDDWNRLLTVLISADFPEGYRDPGFILERIANLLARRPKLALTSLKEIEAVANWVAEVQPIVTAQTEVVLEQVKQGLRI